MKQRCSRISDGVLDAIGCTPLIRFNSFLGQNSIDLLVKLESSNPGGSAKDRPAFRMIQEAIRRGDIGSESTIIESSSGNMGIGLAQACRYYGLRFICVVDPRAQSQNLSIIKALGGQIEMVSDPLHGDFLAARIARVCKLLEEDPNSYWPNQYANSDNPRSHYDGTIREIDEALDGDFDVLLVATSSTGTAQGCRDYLRHRGRDTEVIAVDSIGSALFGGSPGTRRIPGLGAGKIPKLAMGQSFDQIERVTDLECVVGCRRVADREAMLVGGSAGGVLMTVGRLQYQLEGKRCVAVLHDSGERYLDTVFNDQWVEQSLGCSSNRLAELVQSDSFLVDREVCKR
ncbi:2,3-diaminopropionate biosynthesis protein SbnA [Rubripirellula amarantea]|uniref:N-(2-amino-2-carboxyethyl)-L-glutamate synthase n=1 Tax=Rubripirellula amarantea TaxID=2527999 RepID=A0A5C5WTF6_9BACT|nr:2,3-diaminopropionate biosynthesis protein SbnA [Rubripirellula amarantea]MDA8744350.1 2,3-diaminopropionate biosynthesis protein SbnA [Rubripirellula amarantea]TWT53790.1 putative siderophore biosynthesis protein SbnA [Rubripirellula amarantea]